MLSANHFTPKAKAINCLFSFLSWAYGAYRQTIPGFVSKGLTVKERGKILQKSVELALEARDKLWKVAQRNPTHNYSHAMVAASIGSYGAYLADGSEYIPIIHFQFDQHRHLTCLLLYDQLSWILYLSWLVSELFKSYVNTQVHGSRPWWRNWIFIQLLNF